MAKNVLQRYWNGSSWEEIHPVTRAANVFTSSGETVEEAMAGITSTARDTSIVDAENYYAGTDVEAALQEIGQSLVSARGNLITSITGVLGG